MRGRDRLAFRSKLGFLFVPGVVEVLVLPVKTNGPFRGGGKKTKKKKPKHNHLLFRNILQIYHSKG